VEGDPDLESGWRFRGWSMRPADVMGWFGRVS